MLMMRETNPIRAWICGGKLPAPPARADQECGEPEQVREHPCRSAVWCADEAWPDEPPQFLIFTPIMPFHHKRACR